MQKSEYHVDGMTCASCEVLIERALKKVDGVHKVHVNRSKNVVSVELSKPVSLQTLNDAVQSKGYILSEEPHTKKDKEKAAAKKRHIAEIGASAFMLLAIYIVLKYFEILPKGFGVTDNMSYGFVFVLGLVAATSTCLAVAGGLLLALAAKYNEKYPNLTGWQKFKPHISFNIGRILGYTFLGGILGYIGSMLTLSATLSGVITILASVFMIIIGLQLLHIFPFLDKFQIKMPKFIAHKLHEQHENGSSSPGMIKSFIFGAATFFLPCGFTQALQLYVLSSGSFVTGALTMFIFSLGTLPALASIGIFTSFSKGRVQRNLMTVAAVLVILLGVFNIPSGLTLTGVDTSFFGSSTGPQIVPIINGKQVVEMKVEGLEYFPSNFIIQKGVPVDFIIDGSKAEGCAQIFTIPKLDVNEKLPQTGTKTISFTPEEVGTIPFHCSMGMTTAGAAFEVVEAPNNQNV